PLQSLLDPPTCPAQKRHVVEPLPLAEDPPHPPAKGRAFTQLVEVSFQEGEPSSGPEDAPGPLVHASQVRCRQMKTEPFPLGPPAPRNIANGKLGSSSARLSN